jgi:hypothetical protein
MQTQHNSQCGGEHTVIVHADKKLIEVQSPYCRVTHDIRRGGAISALRLTHAGPTNLFLNPIGMGIGFTGDPNRFDHAADVKHTIDPSVDGIRLTFDYSPSDASGKTCGVRFRVIYSHESGYIRMRQELTFPASRPTVAWIILQHWTLHPSLCHYGLRVGAPDDHTPFPKSMGLCQWGHFSPGCAAEPLLESRHVPRYVCFADPGRCGLEWFQGSDLAQWNYQLTGRPGTGSLCISPAANPQAISLIVCPLDLSVGGGGIPLAGRQVFDSFIGIPRLSGKANRLFLHEGFNRGKWPTPAEIATQAERGIDTVHFHHDGDYTNDGIFWRDGVYPPFGPDDMREFDRVIADYHRHKVRVTTYFSNKELHPSTEAFKCHGREWARIPGDRGDLISNQFGNDVFGVQMCLRSGWREFFKKYVDQVLSHHDLDGIYYDWNIPLYCHNAHTPDGSPTPGGIGVQADSPLGHWDVEELLDVMQWTRRRVGPDGLVIIHNSMTPMAAMENFADYVIGMEFGYQKMSLGVPALTDLPLEMNFMGARPRGIISYGCLDPSASDNVRRQWLIRCLLTGATPWSADKLTLELFAPLAGRDLSRYRFFDWRSEAVVSSTPAVAPVSYGRRQDALVLAVNLTSDRARTALLRIDAAGLGLANSPKVLLEVNGKRGIVNRDMLLNPGVRLTVPPNGVRCLSIKVKP